jgi:FkbM family methyltransferase
MIRSLVRNAARDCVRAAVAMPIARRALNAAYTWLPLNGKEWVHTKFARIFYGRRVDGRWDLWFAGQRIRVPLKPESSWLDWEVALSILGHDADVKRAYLHMIGSQSERPDVFIDVGANTGTHSILFLTHGVDTICFEPNSLCRQTLTALCEANEVSPRIEAYCLGQKSGQVTLSFPERETWLGSVKPDVIRNLEKRSGLMELRVEQRTLDDYLSVLSAYKRPLIKIDVEGAESDVIRGAEKVIEKFRPTIILEANGDRGELFMVLAEAGYAAAALSDRRFLTKAEFQSAPETNFLALAKTI